MYMVYRAAKKSQKISPLQIKADTLPSECFPFKIVNVKYLEIRYPIYKVN